MKKITLFSLFMTEDCWGSPTNYLTSRWLADAILRAIDLGCISYTDFHYGTDQEIWDKLTLQKDPIIVEKMKMIMNPQDYFSIINDISEADYIVKSKFRGINPWVLSESEYRRLTEVDGLLAEKYEETKRIISKGWLIKILHT